MNGNTYTASGYGDNSLASLFSKEHLVPDFINENCSAQASWKSLIGSGYMDKLSAGDILRFMKFDGSFEVVPKEWNGTRRYQDMGDVTSICAQLCAPREVAVKRNTCMLEGEAKTMRDQLFDTQMSNTMKAEGQRAFRRVLNMTISGADGKNKGNNAGAITGNINLGSQADPLKIDVSRTATAASIRRDFMDVFGALDDAKDEQDLSDCGSCDWSYKLPEAVIKKMRYIENSENCCNWDNSIMMNGTEMFKDFLGNPLYAAQGNLMTMMPTATGFIAPIVYSCPQVGHFAHGVSCATIDTEHDDETIVITFTEGGVIVRPRLAAVAWVEVVTK
jgi:hypothetical protein